jgi:C4-dicarboxylate transporter/malic acid transport protein
MASPLLVRSSAARPSAWFRELEDRWLVVSNITPNWFAAVMGTGIVATAAATLPLQFPGLRAAAIVVWLIASVILLLVTLATVLHWARFPQIARGHHRNAVMAHFYGAPPMALLTVGAGTILLGQDLIGEQAAVIIDLVLWTLGTVLGLICAVTIPYLTFTRLEASEPGPFGGWLMPVVPPMVSAATGALLLPHLPEGQARLTMLLICYGMFGMSLIASLVIISLIWARLARHKIGPAVMVPTLWIVLGPLGQSVTAVNLLGGNAHLVVPPAWANALELFGVIYGVPILGFALLWGALAVAVTVRVARQGIPFALTWWSFVFPVGTCVTGVTGLAVHTGSVILAAIAGALFLVLVSVWGVVAVRTFHGAIIRGTLLLPAKAA